jgi:N-acyl-D-aspartate/D-glutamate deacylase
MFDTVIRGGTVVDGTGGPAYTADVAVADGRIVEIGEVTGPARAVIDADGAVVTPGFVDIHTHYDGQATWDDAFEPSAAHGVTTVVMGNCGVGFAPVRPADADALIDMMEGVEDIPGTALSVGMPFGEWETFPEYLDFLATRRYALDVAAQIPHAALRFYVMGDRAVTDNDATADELELMAGLVTEALDAGAVGFTTSRTIAHRARTGRFIPGTFAPREELLALTGAMRTAGHGVIEAIVGGSIGNVERVRMIDELPLMAELSATSGRPLTFSTFQLLDQPDMWRELLTYSASAADQGAVLRPQVIPRAITFFTSLRTYHMFMFRPTYKKLAGLPLAERVAQMRRPEIRDAILAETTESVDRRDIAEVLTGIFQRTLYVTFPFTDPVDYEPTPDRSVRSEAQRLGKLPQEHMYDLLLEDEGRALYMILSSNYVSGDLDVCREMMLDPNTVTGNGDSGAHVSFISDCSVSTYHLTHWTRDRTRGERLPLELMVAKLTGGNARLYGFDDRGTVEVGKRADLNVIDLERLSIGQPELRHDLPADATRILQPATGYLATMVHGVTTRRHDQDTGARPGLLVRGAATTGPPASS